jgi:exodeoxyribonuclease V beta subunit
MKEVDVFTHPLAGLSLMEASAGTGKTTTLVRLYLRALLVEKFGIEQILAVTYTRAATGELSVRIREALVEAGEQLRSTRRDAFWARLFAQAGDDRETLQKRIDAALAGFDEKAVFTIHGFCQRILADHAFEAGSAFASEPIEDEDALRGEAAADFWRRRTSDAASPSYVRWLVDTLQSPTRLRSVLARALAVSGALRIEPEMNAEAIARAEKAFAAAAATAREAWRREGDGLRDWLINSDDLHRNKYRRNTMKRLLEEWDRWLNDAPNPCLPKNLERLTREKLEAGLRDGELPEAAFFAWNLAGELIHAAEKLQHAWWQETLASAHGFLRDEMRRRKRQRRELGYDDMLHNLADALKAPFGNALAANIAARFPLILVDEFQDTDPVQYDIFARVHAAEKAHGLVLIGDPKQAIYRFRGADVFTYIQARRDCKATGRLYGLLANYRGSAGLLDALNALFSRAREPFEHGDIPYVPVHAGRRVAPLILTDGNGAALNILWQPAPPEAKRGLFNKDDGERLVAEICAGEVAHLLALGAAERACYETEDGQHCVGARDVAVLVNTNEQGALVRRALRRHGIAAALASRQSVFASAEAEELEILLAAVAEPGNGKRLRRAFITSLLEATAADLERWSGNETAWAAIVADFRAYRQCWRKHGFAAMFARLLNEQGIARRTLAREEGERAMTNLRHLGELASAEAARRPGIAPLLAWFERERMSASEEEARQLRLESDQNLVRIATVHRAKGLEYPIVFLPFLWHRKTPRAQRYPSILTHTEDDRAVLDLGSSFIAERQAEAVREAHAEEARKTYVSLTRAERACYLIALPANDTDQSALGRLLQARDAASFKSGLEAWRKNANGAVAIRAPIAAGLSIRGASERAYGEARAFEYPQRLRQRFHLASYSLLAAGASGGAAELPEHDEGVKALPQAEPAFGIHAFPAGPESGVLLHALIETLDFDADAKAIETAVEHVLAIHGFDAQWSPIVAAWIGGLFATPLAVPACRLGDIRRGQRIDELEFYFPLRPIEAKSLEVQLRAFAPQGSRPRLNFSDVAGQMKGYLDLVFEHQGRYWIADYKSNRLGADLAAYTPAALDRAMADHRYDLQYLIYTVALHRYLRSRIGDYDYERHFGGLLYLFVRGMAPGAPAPRGVWHTRPARADIERLDAYLAGSERD